MGDGYLLLCSAGGGDVRKFTNLTLIRMEGRPQGSSIGWATPYEAEIISSNFPFPLGANYL